MEQWGLGESVVTSHCNPDRYVINKKTREVDKTINAKTTQVIYCEMGTEQVDVPVELQNQACLTDEELAALADLCAKVEDYYGGVPQDLEWALECDGTGPSRLFLVQTRNITKTVEQKSKAQILADMLVKSAYAGRTGDRPRANGTNGAQEQQTRA